MWPVGVVVVDVVDDELFGLLLVPDDGAVEEFSADGADPVGARNSVVPGQAAFRYSLMSPSHRVDLIT